LHAYFLYVISMCTLVVTVVLANVLVLARSQQANHQANKRTGAGVSFSCQVLHARSRVAGGRVDKVVLWWL